MNLPAILDMCCGSRMFWFNKSDPRAVYLDARSESHVLCDNRKLEIRPDVLGDFRQLPFADGQFLQVVYDPPHLRRAGPVLTAGCEKSMASWIKRTGVKIFAQDLQKHFACWRPAAR